MFVLTKRHHQVFTLLNLKLHFLRIIFFGMATKISQQPLFQLKHENLFNLNNMGICLSYIHAQHNMGICLSYIHHNITWVFVYHIYMHKITWGFVYHIYMHNITWGFVYHIYITT